MSNPIELTLAAAVLLAVGWLSGFATAQSPGWAFAEILLLGLAILATLCAFWRVRPATGWLLVPYLAWVSFAAVLNGSIWILNK